MQLSSHLLPWLLSPFRRLSRHHLAVRQAAVARPPALVAAPILALLRHPDRPNQLLVRFTTL